ncbi:Glycine--tRNA ligase, chloroplastic/mitochondrial 2 [Galdieria sulphuraria]|nr:Glycine--tRNA ligase, chloroplastic/mitochondrial 2 [Galdieria sulphuraria]
MSLQGVSHFKEIQYNNLFSYGDLFLQNEYEMSRFYLDEADISRHKTLLQLYEEECRFLLRKQLPIAAYEFVLKSSHTFNILDARGAVGVTERAKMFQGIRSLACDVASAWLKTRESLHFPLLEQKNNLENGQNNTIESFENIIVNRRTSTMRLIDKEYDFFVLEIGTEELPKDAIHLAKVQCETAFSKLLDSNRLDWRGNILCGVTPRRIVLMIPELATWQSPQTKKLRGPPAKIAYKESGEATEALLGFCRTQGVSVSSVTVEHDKNSDYVFATKYESGSSTIEVMTEMLPPFLHSLTFARTMKWNDTLVNFPRPIRWLFAMLGEETIRFHYAGLEATNCTFGLRIQSKSPPIILKDAKNYLSSLENQGIMLDTRQRRTFIWEQASAIATDLNGKLYPSDKGQEGDDCLLQEVSCLVESPVVSYGINVISPCNMELVRKGNESVLRARYTDAEFFYRHDLMQSFDSFRQKLQGLTFQESLGSMLDKNIRLERMVSILHDQLQLTPEESRDLRTAAQLCKVDLASSMVIEFTSLAGVMGKYYALENNYSIATAIAIEEHHLPRYYGDKLPSSRVGALLGIIDRVDSLVGLFAAGCLPRASADPFGLRRTALGLVQVCVLHEMDVNLRHYFEIAAKLQPIAVPCQVIDQALSFVMKRLETWLTEDEATWDIANHEADVIQAVLAEQSSGNPFQIVNILKLFMKEREKPYFGNAIQAYARPAKLLLSVVTKDWSEIPEIPDPTLFETEDENGLYYIISKDYEAMNHYANNNLSQILETLARWKPFIDTFFENVFVMSSDYRIRYNRIALCRMITKITTGIIDLTKLLFETQVFHCGAVH